MNTCEHKWVHLRKEDSKEIRWHVWATVDRFYCEKCLEQKTVEMEIQRENPRW